jgi:ribose transport system substrate-binding protein
MKRKFNVALMLLVAVLPLLAACGAADTSITASAQPSTAASTAAPASEAASTAPESSESASTVPEASDTASTAPQASEAASAAPEASAAGGASQPFTIGVSNPFISSEYRTQMIQELIDTNKEYMDQGITTELEIESADTDVAGQIQQLQNLINKGVDAILVNPGDVNGLNATLQDAVNQGIIVISVDQELDVPNVYNVGIDQKEWAKTSAQWLADKLGGTGNIVLIEGFPGHPANVARMSGVDEVLANYPDITVLGKDTGRWDEATGQQVMSNFLASFPNLDGYWTQDGMAIGAFQAVLAANPAEFPVAVLEGRCQALQLWNDRLAEDPSFESIAVANHPGVSPTGLRIAVNMLQGKQVDTSKLGGANGLSFVLPVPVVVTKDNFQEVFETQCAGKPPAYLLDNILTDEEVQQYFVQ